MNHLIRGIALGAAGLGAASYAGIRAFIAAGEKKRREAPGNADQYKPEKQEKHPDSPLNGKTIIFLGSSVTYGAASGAESFVELFEAVDGVKAVKEAVSGTTLADQISVPAMLFFGSGDSYVKRMKKLDRNMKADCLVCQLSTNDATMKKPLGVISEGDDLSSFDAKTVTGAMETIIRYAKDTWNCPVIFYTGSYYESACMNCRKSGISASLTCIRMKHSTPSTRKPMISICMIRSIRQRRDIRNGGSPEWKRI